MRLFSRQVGKTIGQQLLELRMSKAARLLQVPSMPIKQIALQCGYDDLSNFYRDFKRVHRATPKDVRLSALAWIAMRVLGPAQTGHTANT
jgi:AraC-like DNA-binding protein